MSRWNRVTLLAALDERLTQLGYRSPLVLPTNPFDIAAKEGIVISYKPLLDDSLAGWIFKGEHTSTIVLNEYTRARWVFTLMHELIHYWFHPCGMYCDRTGDSGLCDTQANYAAVEALMPAAAVREIAAQLDYSIRHTAHVFGVSTESMAIRFEELELTRPSSIRRIAYAYQPATIRMAAEDPKPYRTHKAPHPMSPSPASDIAGVKLSPRKALHRGEIA
jgi:Zn-dependent peptidase ImmA (M78 family)